MTLEKTRQLVKQRIEKRIMSKGIYLAPWDLKRIAWEDTMLADFYHDNIESLDNILTEACEGTGYFIEFINSVEGHFCKA